MHSIDKFNCIIIYSLLFLLICTKVAAQNDNISFEHFTSDNGLSAPVTEIIQDYFGFLWLGTTDGLNRFDGKNFIVYRNIQGDSTSLSNNIINDLCVDNNNRIWLATNGGLCYYDFSDDAFHKIEYSDTLEKIDRHRVYAVTTGKNGEIWFATKTLLRYWNQGKEEKTISIPDSGNLSVKYLYNDNKNHIWIGTNDRLFVFNITDQSFIQNKLSSPFSIRKKLSVTVHPIVSFNEDTLFSGSWYGGLQKVFVSGNTIKTIPLVDSTGTDPRRHIVTGISDGGNSHWWIGTYGDGLSLFDAGENKFIKSYHHNPADAKSLSNDYINKIYKDATGIIWIGTASGLDKYDPLKEQFKTISIPVSANEFSVYRLPSSIIRDKNNPDWLWITVSGAGLYHFNSVTGAFKLYSVDLKNSYSMPDNNIYTLFYDDKGRIWTGLKSGVYMFDEKREKFSGPVFKGQNVPLGAHQIFQDDQKRFWIATYSFGIYCYDEPKDQLTNYSYKPDDNNSLPDNRVFCMLYSSDKKIWIGTQNQGLCYLEPATNKFTFFHHDRSDTSSLPDNGVYDLHEDDNHQLWIATENGFACMDLHNYKIKTFTTKDGLCNNDIFSITPDKQNHLWLGTNSGLCSFDPVKIDFKNYYIHDGLPENHISGAVHCDDDGGLIFGSFGTLSFCQPKNMKINLKSPPIIITNFKIFDKQIPVMRKDEMLETIRLSYRQNMITFDFAALNFSNSLFNQYAYRLDGFDKDWIYCGSKQSATYTNLDGGDYTFRVKAANNDGVWNEKGTFVNLMISTPWWKTWWFYLLSLIGILGILYSIYRIRINQLIQLQKIRMRISRDLHDDIGSTLSSINMISSMANNSPVNAGKSSDYFKTISSASQQAMELMNDIVWSINPKNDQVEMIAIRIRQYASEILEAAGIDFNITIDEASKRVMLSAEKKKNFYLIFKEAINNLAKYSGARNADISIKYLYSNLILKIQDNGKGFDSSQKFEGNGLKNMLARAIQLNGKLTINSEPGNGTRIILDMPVP